MREKAVHSMYPQKNLLLTHAVSPCVFESLVILFFNVNTDRVYISLESIEK